MGCAHNLGTCTNKPGEETSTTNESDGLNNGQNNKSSNKYAEKQLQAIYVSSLKMMPLGTVKTN
jgi:hypothetical protein